jgi:hypothetical protein
MNSRVQGRKRQVQVKDNVVRVVGLRIINVVIAPGPDQVLVNKYCQKEAPASVVRLRQKRPGQMLQVEAMRKVGNWVKVHERFDPRPVLE